MKKVFLFLLSAMLLLGSCSTETKTPSFEIKRGFNVSHWLSQSRLSIEQRATYFTEQDIADFASWGFDHIRLPIDERTMWDENHNKIEANWEYMKSAIEWCIKYDMKCIVDLHTLRSHSFMAKAGTNPLFNDPACQDWLVEMWQQLSAYLCDFPTSVLAYEFMNEPVAGNPQEWNDLIVKVHAALRALEPERFLVIGSNNMQSVDAVADLQVPENDPYIIIAFHYYLPALLTHYKAGFTPFRDFKGTIHYPGNMITAEEYEALDEVSKELGADYTRVWDRQYMEDMIRPAVEKARSLGLQIYCGEWGVINNTPRDIAENWYADMIKIFDDLDIAWTTWDIKAEFGIWNGNQIDPDFLKLLQSGKGLND